MTFFTNLTMNASLPLLGCGSEMSLRLHFSISLNSFQHVSACSLHWISFCNLSLLQEFFQLLDTNYHSTAKATNGEITVRHPKQPLSSQVWPSRSDTGEISSKTNYQKWVHVRSWSEVVPHSVPSATRRVTRYWWISVIEEEKARNVRRRPKRKKTLFQTYLSSWPLFVTKERSHVKIVHGS